MHNNYFFEMLSKKNIFIFSILIFFCSIYYSVIYALNNENINFENLRIIQTLIILVYLYLIIHLVIYLRKHDYDKIKTMNFLFMVSSIQGVICILMLLFPSLKSISNNIFINNSSFEAGSYIFTTRIYGISISYTYGLPILHGIISGICLLYGLFYNKKYLLYYPFIFIVIVLNGRTGLLISFLLAIIIFFFCIIKKYNIFKLFKYLFLLLMLSFAIIYFLKTFMPNIYRFISYLFTEISLFVSTGETTGTVEYLVNGIKNIPSGFALIFGSGIRPYDMAFSSIKTDIGFINYLYMGGLIYLITFVGSFINFTFVTTRKDDIKLTKYLLFISLMIACWKGEALSNSTILIGLFYILMNDYIENKNL